MKTIFWNVDTQYDFMRYDETHKGELPVPGARAIEGNLEKLTKLARAKKVRVVNTADWHNEKTKEISETPDFKTTFPAHCMIGTKGAEYVPATAPNDPYFVDWRDEKLDEEAVLAHKGDLVLYKDKFGIFDGTPHAERVVDLLKPERVIVYGVATNVCVDLAVNGLLDRNIEVIVATDAIKELPDIPSPVEAWVKRGAKLVETDNIAKYVA